ncbi:MAG: hypothetical protein OXE94_11850 [Aestuariivita sp.]|nr:hypothetical protein [Aestuariivita sp.]MCY4203936.1 hypothetical protein [Aestuariivita sp.]
MTVTKVDKPKKFFGLARYAKIENDATIAEPINSAPFPQVISYTPPPTHLSLPR